MKNYFPKCHIELSKGSLKANELYCSKDGKTTTRGVPAVDTQGTRSDLIEVMQSVRDGISTADLYESHYSVMAKYPRFVQGYRSLHMERIVKEKYKRGGSPDVRLRVGKPGLGKTRFIYENYHIDDIYSVILGGSSQWFDGYIDQKIVLFDDYDGQIKYTFFLKLLDRYPIQVPVKGAFVWWGPSIIYITSNTNIREWYIGKDVTALERRITSIDVLV